MDDLTRRTFLHTGAAAVGVAATGALARPPRARAAGGAAEDAPKPRMHLGLVTYMVGAKMKLPTLIATCEQSGMEGVELRSTHAHGVEPHISKARRREVVAMFADSPVRLYALGSACEYHSPDPKVVAKNIDETKRFVDLAADLGCWGVKIRPNGLPKNVPEEKTLAQIAEAIRTCAEYAGPRKITLFVECHGRGTSRPDRMAAIIREADHPWACLCWNSNGVDVEEGSIARYFKLCEPYIQHVHIHTLTEKGYPWEELFRLLKAADFRRFTMIETHTKGEDPVAFLKAQRQEWQRLVGFG
ncbi:MAG: sugar phosphate isomerase/epimerase family protein [Phycisphaerae bacterium]